MGKQTEDANVEASTELAKTSEVVLEAPSTEVLQALSLKISNMARTSVLTLTLNIGQAIIEDLYGGDFALYKSQGRKDTSLAALAELPEFPISVSDLSRCVAIYELSEILGTREWNHLTKSHFRAVLPLREEKQKVKLLEEAESKELSVRELESRVRKLKKGTSDGRGRPRLPAFEKAINGLGKWVETAAFSSDLEKLDDMEADRIQQLHGSVVEARAALDELEKQLQARIEASS